MVKGKQKMKTLKRKGVSNDHERIRSMEENE